MHVLLRKLLSKFVKSTVIAASDITEIEYLFTDNQKENYHISAVYWNYHQRNDFQKVG